MRIYEELFIVRPDATEEEVDPLIEQVKGVITHAGGTIDRPPLPTRIKKAKQLNINGFSASSNIGDSIVQLRVSHITNRHAFANFT